MRSLKECPACGFKNTKTMRQIMREWRVMFGDLPVWEMMKRRWIAQPEDLSDIAQVRDDLRRFFGLKTDEELTEFLRDNILPSGNPLRRVINGENAPTQNAALFDRVAP